MSEFGDPQAGYRVDPKDIGALGTDLHALLDTCIDTMKTTRDDFWNPPDNKALAAQFSLADNDNGSDTKAVYDKLRAIMPYGSNQKHPRWWGWVNGGGNMTAVGAELVAATINTNMGGRNQGCVEVERAVIDYLVKTAGMDSQKSFGVLTTGTSQATVLAMAAARAKKFGLDVKKKGIRNLPDVAVYVKNGAHVCVEKAIELLGHGSDSMRHFEDFAQLTEMVAADKSKGIVPMAIVGTAGCVNRGTYDDLNAIGRFCEQEDIWFHVDGAFGYWILLADPKWSRLISGIERANSVALDFHKWVGVPYAVGACLMSDRELHYKTFSNRPSYLTPSIGDTPGSDGLAGGDLWFCDYGIDLSRPFHALKCWTTLKSVGTKKIGQFITDNCRQAARMENIVKTMNKNGDMSIVMACDVVSNVVCMNLAGVDSREIAAKLQVEKKVVFSTTLVNGQECLRAAFVNHRTTDADIDYSIAEVCKLLPKKQ
jgi:glutamate/tyrosine decarboxylase-like PLP-dependent enzyme